MSTKVTSVEVPNYDISLHGMTDGEVSKLIMALREGATRCYYPCRRPEYAEILNDLSDSIQDATGVITDGDEDHQRPRPQWDKSQ